MDKKWSFRSNKLVAAVCLGLLGSAAVAQLTDNTAAPGVNEESRSRMPHMQPIRNASGFAATFSTSGDIDQRNPFFQSLGTNGRSCATCHQQSEGWTVTPRGIQVRFDATAGRDPIFRLNDGANSPNADVATAAARRKAYSMLLHRGLIRVGIGIPTEAEFELVHADDPYGFASAKELSLFRRPLPTTNLTFLSTVMWDGRETFKDANATDCIFGTTTCFASLHFDLADQSNAATVGHAQAAQPLSTAQREAIVAFETGLFTAQIFDDNARSLTRHHALGGPRHLAEQTFYFGINDVVVGDYRTHAAFNPNVFTLYEAWNRFQADLTSKDEEDSAEKSRCDCGGSPEPFATCMPAAAALSLYRQEALLLRSQSGSQLC